MARKTIFDQHRTDERVDVFAGQGVQPSGFPLDDTLRERQPSDADATALRPFGLRFAVRPHPAPPVPLERLDYDPRLQTLVMPDAPDPERAAVVRMGTARNTPPDGSSPTRPHDLQTD